jgi:hypothetical protein
MYEDNLNYQEPQQENQDYQQDAQHAANGIKTEVTATAEKVGQTLTEAKDRVYRDVQDSVTVLKDKYQSDIQPKVVQLKDQLQTNLVQKKDAANTMLHEKVLDNSFSFKNLVWVFVAGWFVGRIARR